MYKGIPIRLSVDFSALFVCPLNLLGIFKHFLYLLDLFLHYFPEILKHLYYHY